MTQPKTHSEPVAVAAFRERFAERLAAFRTEDEPTEVARTGVLERAGWRMAGAGVPDDAADALDLESPTAALQRAQAWWATDGRCLLLLGSVGVGKTTAAAWCVREAIADELATHRPSGNDHLRPDAARFVLASQVSRMSLYGREAHEDFERLCRARLLVVDDFGREKLSEVAGALFDELLTRRLGSRRCRTVITSNLGKKELAERVGARIADRLKQHAVSEVLTGESLRRKP